MDEDAPDLRQSVRLYVCHEPENTSLAACLGAWPRVNDNVGAYNARAATAVDSPEGAVFREQCAAGIRSASVFACIVTQGTCFDPWVNWEIEQAVQAQGPALVCILTHDADQPPSVLRDRGAIFVRFQRAQIERAIEWCGENRENRDDFRLSEELDS